MGQGKEEGGDRSRGAASTTCGGPRRRGAEGESFSDLSARCAVVVSMREGYSRVGERRKAKDK